MDEVDTDNSDTGYESMDEVVFDRQDPSADLQESSNSYTLTPIQLLAKACIPCPTPCA
jgi:hypothetical protein